MNVQAPGRRLHNEIVYPLLGALLAVGVTAVVLGVTVMGSLSERWVDEQARSVSKEAAAFVVEYAGDLARACRLASNDHELADALGAGDLARVSARLAELSAMLRPDGMFVVGDDGTTISAVGNIKALPGDALLADDVLSYARIDMAFTTVLEFDGVTYVCSLYPVRSGRYKTVVLGMCEAVDAQMLARVPIPPGSAAAVLGHDGRPLAVRAASDAEDASELEAALRKAMDPKTLPGVSSWSVQLQQSRYRVHSQSMTIPGDPRKATLWVLGAAPTTIVESIRASTTLLIVLWTVVAIGSLFGLGWYLARRVGTPIAQLSEAVERVASGDYTVEFDVEGQNEIAVLSENLAKMTDSLKERTEGLTRKVLELATLYEMSRVLGSTLDLDVLLDAVLDSTLRIFDADVGYVVLVDRESQELSLRAWRGTPRVQQGSITGGGSMAEWVVKEGRPLLFNPPHAADGKGRKVEPTTGAAAAACVPMHGADGVIGALAVGSTDPEARFTSEDVRLLSTIANHATIAVGNIELYQSLQDSYLSTVRALAAAIDAKDPYTRGHSERVATYALMIAERIGLSAEQQDALEMASYLHDIGKIGIPEDILLKPGKLSDEEMGQMRHHPLIGANILKPVSFPWPILPVVRHHHEHYDGRGYPAGLRGEEIPLLARILTVADSYEAMTSDRPYRRGRSTREAIVELRRCAGTQFDPALVDAFTQVLESIAEEPGSAASAAAAAEGAAPEQGEAALSAVCDGVMAAFRRLGGPRLAANVEREANARLAESGLPFSLRSGHLVASVDGEPREGDLSKALAIVLSAVRQAAGAGLASQFVADALQQLPPRMRALAEAIAADAIGQRSE